MVFHDVIEYMFDTTPSLAKSIDRFKSLKGSLLSRILETGVTLDPDANEFHEIGEMLHGIGMYIEDRVQEELDQDQTGLLSTDSHDKSFIWIYFSQRKKPLVEAVFKTYEIDTRGIVWK